MTRIFKYQLPMGVNSSIANWKERFSLDIPKGSKVLTVQAQGNVPMIWVLVDPEALTVKIPFLLLATGSEIPGDIRCHYYIGSFQLNGGALVFHLFEDMS